MAIDWFTILAQAINFLVLVWLMKRYLYKPVLDAIDAREKRVAAHLTSADKKKAEAKKESEEFRDKNEKFEQQRATLLKKATDEAQAESHRLLEEARQTVLAQSTHAKESLQTQMRDLQDAIGLRIQGEVFAVARKALADLAGADVEVLMVKEFVRRLRDLSDAEKTRFQPRSEGASDPVVVHTASELSPAQRKAVSAAAMEVFGAQANIQFEVNPETIRGIEMVANGYKVGWSIAEYLTSLEKDVTDSERGRSAAHGV